MSGKIFISCGQASDLERVVAREVAAWFESEGFSKPYVATQVQSIQDLNHGIVSALKSSDYYLFINFRREMLPMGSGDPLFRGSLYTNQELAIAYAFGFEHMILLNQRYVERGGIFGTIVSNTPEFEKYDEVLPVVQRAVRSAGWFPQFSRQLVLEKIDWHDTSYGERVPWEGFDKTPYKIWVLQGSVSNRRSDIAGMSAVARLRSIQNKEGHTLELTDVTNLKVTDQMEAFQQTIWPASTGRFDLLAIDVARPYRVFLMSNYDNWPRRPILQASGSYRLEYQIVALGFAPLDFAVELELNGEAQPRVSDCLKKEFPACALIDRRDL